MMILTILALAMAQAEPPLDCENQVTQADMNQCAHIAYRTADAELNQQWVLALAAARASDREIGDVRRGGRRGFAESLLAAQRAWLVYRDNHCVLNSYDAIGGSAEPMLYSYCLRDLTETRTEQLRSFTTAGQQGG
ncbi:MAG: lysozyme inhibitor LprI family protein [Sphingopyxis sp.]